MKKQWLPLVVAVFFLAPAASAADGSTVPTFDHFLGQLVAFFTGEVAEIGHLYPPHGQPSAGEELGELYPPGGLQEPAPAASMSGEQEEIGSHYPPHGQSAASIGEADPGDQQEIGHLYPPHG